MLFCTTPLHHKETNVPVHEIKHPLVCHKLGLMRRDGISTKDFRDLASEVARLLTYEATSDLETEKETIMGWAGPVSVDVIKGKKINYKDFIIWTASQQYCPLIP